jgi:hypothetical protein
MLCGCLNPQPSPIDDTTFFENGLSVEAMTKYEMWPLEDNTFTIQTLDKDWGAINIITGNPPPMKLYKEIHTKETKITLSAEEIQEINKSQGVLITVDSKGFKKSINLFRQLHKGTLTIEMHKEIYGIPTYPVYSGQINKYEVILTVSSTTAFIDSIIYRGKEVKYYQDIRGGYQRVIFFVDYSIDKESLQSLKINVRSYSVQENLSCKVEVWSPSIYNNGFERELDPNYGCYNEVGRNKLAEYDIELKEKVVNNITYTN